MDNKECLIDKMINEYTLNGISGLFKKIWNKIHHFLFYTTYSVWYERDLCKSILHFSPDCTVETDLLQYDKSKIIEWLKENKTNFPWIYFEKEISSAISNDHIYFTVTCQSSIIGYVKIGIGSTYIHDFDKSIEFNKGIAFIYDTFVLPEYRGKKLALYSLNQIAQYLKEKNYTKILCHIEKCNIPSIRTFENAGFSAKDSLRFTRIARFSFFVRSGCFPVFNVEDFLK